MHELSVAMAVCQMAEERLGVDALPRVIRVAVTVGDDSGIEPAHLEFCLDALFATPPFTGAKTVLARCPGDALHLDYLEVDDGRSTD
jgi:Zn finger protein HypA/HybF involved in hydrogenase expression